MKKAVLLLMGLLLLSVPVLAYQVNIEAPDSLAVGKPLVVTGTTTFGTGTPIDVVLYYQMTTTSEVQRRIAYVLSDKTFKTVFDTTGLKTGTYKVEVPSTANSDDVTMRIVTIYDRSEDIALDTPVNQAFTGKIYLTGDIRGLENSGIQVEVVDLSGSVIYGPMYVHTDNAAHFAFEVPVPAPGIYEVSFTDANGYVGSRTVTTVSSGGIIATAVTTGAVEVDTARLVSAHARSSRGTPAYFIVHAGSGPVSLYTSRSPDWVIEYTDDEGVLHMVNEQGDQNPERVEILGSGQTLYFKIYPYKYSTTSDVFLYGENVGSIEVSPTVPSQFRSSGDASASETRGAPLFPLLGAAALVIAGFVYHMRRN
jgi:hypothetical protein